MQGYNVGYYIRRIRQEKGISQEALYAGLCSRSTIHRIESGKQQPTMFTAIHLLQRLGLDENSFLVPLGPQDFEICNLKKEIVALNAQFQFEQALERIDRLEKLVAPKEKLAQQFLLRSRALAGYWQDGKRQPYDYPTQRQMLLDALEITHPDFDLEKEREGAKKVADAMKAEGWLFASHTWGHQNIGQIDLDHLQTDTQKFKDNVDPLIGGTDIIIFAFGTDLTVQEDYSGDKFEYLKSVGYNYYCNVDSSQYFVQIRDRYFRQGRRNLDGYRMYYNPELLEDLFDAKEVFDPARPTPVPPME